MADITSHRVGVSAVVEIVGRLIGQVANAGEFSA
jgi:hypothetical protein